MTESQSVKNSGATPSAHVRFTEDEYRKIQKAQNLTGLSIPVLLKKAFFLGKNPHVLLPEEERKAWFGELRKWGNNLNQIARKLNSGVFEGWYPEFQEVSRRLVALEAMVTSFYGNR